MSKRKALVPLDGSEFSLLIIPHVRKLLRPDENELILMRVGAEPSGWNAEPERPTAVDFDGSIYPPHAEPQGGHHQIYATQEEESRRAAMEDELRDELEELRTAGYSVSLEVCFGEPADEIVAFAKHHEVDLIAMTTHGRTGLGRLFVGSVAEQVVRQASVPLLLFHPGEET
jgi:nucleotide-binding universal stress UspA family protein